MKLIRLKSLSSPCNMHMFHRPLRGMLVMRIQCKKICKKIGIFIYF